MGNDSIPLDASIISARRRHNLHCRKLQLQNHRRNAAVSVSALPTMAADRIENFEDFVKVHALLLQASGLPPSLRRQLFQKLYSETFDSGDFFQVQPCENGRQRRLVLTSEFMEKESHVFLIDHAWTFRLSDAPKQVPILIKPWPFPISRVLVFTTFGCWEKEGKKLKAKPFRRKTLTELNSSAGSVLSSYDVKIWYPFSFSTSSR